MQTANRFGRGLLAPLVVAACALAPCASRAAPAGDLILTGAKPDRLFVVDAHARRVRSEFRIPGANGFIGTIVPSPDGRIAYVLVNKMESIVGIDLKTGRAVFRADLSSPGERVKDFFAFAVTPDGRQLVAYELPTRLKDAEYEVGEPRFSVFRTDAGLKAKAVRRFPAPRRVHLLLMRPGGRTFYAVGFDLYEYDLASGRQVGKQGILEWARPDHGQPDLLAFWPVTEPTGVFTSPVYADEKAAAPAAAPPAGAADAAPATVAKTALMQLDVATGKLDYRDFEPTSALIFSTVLSPDRRHAYGVYSTLTKVDVAGSRLEKRVPLDHTYYSVNIASDGSEVYAGGAMCDVAFYDAATLVKKDALKLPGCGDQALATLRVIRAR
jgi:quinohemoprotein amine dehydrogenase beta subunit